MTPGKNSLLKKLTLLLLLGLGAYGCVSALVGLARTAIYVHESVPVSATVTNYIRRPFASTKEALASGNLSWGGSPAYFAHVSFRFDNGIPITDLELRTPDNEPYRLGAPLAIRTYPYDPTQPEHAQWRPEGVRPNKAALLWGGDALQLLLSFILAAGAWLTLKKKRKKPAAKPAGKAKSKSGKTKKAAPKTKRKAPAPQQTPPPAPPASGEDEEPFSLSADPAPPKKKRSPRQPKATGSDTTNAPKKRPRKKKS